MPVPNQGRTVEAAGVQRQVLPTTAELNILPTARLRVDHRLRAPGRRDSRTNGVGAADRDCRTRDAHPQRARNRSQRVNRGAQPGVLTTRSRRTVTAPALVDEAISRLQSVRADRACLRIRHLGRDPGHARAPRGTRLKAGARKEPKQEHRRSGPPLPPFTPRSSHLQPPSWNAENETNYHRPPPPCQRRAPIRHWPTSNERVRRQAVDCRRARQARTGSNQRSQALRFASGSNPAVPSSTPLWKKSAAPPANGDASARNA